MKRVISIFILTCFLVTGQIGAYPIYAQDFRLPAPGVMVRLSPAFSPPILKGIKVHPDNSFRFDFILDKGESQLSNDALKDESSKLIKYFLASLTIPDKDLWVNLSPYEKDRIIPNSFGLTEMGRDLLAEDYMLKQITASLIYPEDETGKKFWKRVYEVAEDKFGTTNIPVNTFNKVWIVPQKAVVYENAKAGTAYVVESKLKVMLEQDYLSLEKHLGVSHNDTSSIGANIVREIVIPELTKEVNENKNFVQLRQVYNSLILATWYKKKIKDSILEQVYANKNKVAGVNIDDPQEKQKIYERYLQAFKKGVYNYIKEEAIAVPGVPSKEQEILPRKYFSGGIAAQDMAMKVEIVNSYVPNDQRGLEEIDTTLSLVDGHRVNTKTETNPLRGFNAYGGDFKKLIEFILSTRYSNWGLPKDLAHKIVQTFTEHSNNYQEARASIYRNVIDFRSNQNIKDVYAYYKNQFKNQFYYEEILENRLGSLSSGSVVLDWGAGSNTLGYAIAKNLPRLHVIGTDIVVPKIDTHRPNLEFVLMENGSKVSKIASHSVDVIIMNGVIHHISSESLDDVLEEMRRILKPDGKLLLIEDTYSIHMTFDEALADFKITSRFLQLVRKHGDQFARDYFIFSDWYSNVVFNSLDEMPFPYNFKSMEEWQQFLEERGFKSGYSLQVGFPKIGFHQPNTGVLEFYLNESQTQKKSRDSALLAKNHKDQIPLLRKGGIDLTPANMHLQTQNVGQGIKFHLDPAMLKQLQNAPGFVPVIINIQPMTNLRQFLGLNAQASTPSAS